MTPRNPRLGTAVVVGGSIAGLLAAAAVAPHTDEVVVLERDALPEEPGHRSGTPQAAHIHGLLASGRASMERLLPGFTDDLVAHGGLVGDIGDIGALVAARTLAESSHHPRAQTFKGCLRPMSEAA